MELLLAFAAPALPPPSLSLQLGRAVKQKRAPSGDLFHCSDSALSLTSSNCSGTRKIMLFMQTGVLPVNRETRVNLCQDFSEIIQQQWRPVTAVDTSWKPASFPCASHTGVWQIVKPANRIGPHGLHQKGQEHREGNSQSQRRWSHYSFGNFSPRNICCTWSVAISRPTWSSYLKRRLRRKPGNPQPWQLELFLIFSWRLSMTSHDDFSRPCHMHSDPGLLIKGWAFSSHTFDWFCK